MVRLRRPCHVYNFDAGDMELRLGDWVIVETSRGLDAGQVVVRPYQVSPEEAQNNLRAVVRRGTAADMRRMERSRAREDDDMERAQAIVDEMGLPMRLIAADYAFNRRSLTIYFTAERRVDFRKLVKRLARTLRTRIELRQVGARDEARLIGGIGPCGRLLCCQTFLPQFHRISIRMAKRQNLPLNPMKISGLCGRLLCCLRYEHDQYQEIQEELPEVGEEVTTLRGRGKVVDISVPKEAAFVEVRPELTIEVTAEELRQAAQLEEEGRLKQAQASYLSAAPEAPVPPEKTAPAEKKPEKKRRRRRRRRKKPRRGSGKEGGADTSEKGKSGSGRGSKSRRRSRRRPKRSS